MLTTVLERIIKATRSQSTNKSNRFYLFLLFSLQWVPINKYGRIKQKRKLVKSNLSSIKKTSNLYEKNLYLSILTHYEP